ncbi:MAG: mannosyltransferase family protein [Propionicimonas sp.]|uniref:mannosyltransferase family protein n=1 Tax=Propionicimonas sp. TaxID=1955623 RepID=UPI003D0C5978
MSTSGTRVASRRPGRPSRRRAQTTADARLVVQAWFGTRLVIFFIAAWVMVYDHRSASDVFGNWDVVHYLGIAANGYAEANSIAFFPGWPLLVRLAATTGVPALVVGILLALVASGFATAALYRLGGAPAAIAWLLAPTAVFTVVPYTEAVFCAAAFWAWERATAKQWGAAAVLAAVAASVRVSGVFLIAALAVLALTQAGAVRDRGRRLLWLAIPVAVVAAYLGYLYVVTGSWTAWLDAQEAGWARGFAWPWESLKHTLAVLEPGAYADHPEWHWVFLAEIISMAVGLLVTIVCLVRRRWGEATWVGLQVVAFGTSYWFMSVNRAVLLWFPLWTELGRLVPTKGRPPAWRAALIGVVVVVALVVQAAWAWLFYTGRWAS